jgi:hypothetical protein
MGAGIMCFTDRGGKMSALSGLLLSELKLQEMISGGWQKITVS